MCLPVSRWVKREGLQQECDMTCVFVSVQPNGVLCLMDIAAGMEHLHSLGVLHVRSLLKLSWAA